MRVLTKEDLLFNEEQLLSYLKDFDYIYEKYGYNKRDKFYVDYAELESMQLGADVVKRDYSSIHENIKLVYGDSEKANKMMDIYKIVKEEVVNKFLNIPGLERLYDEHFFDFEWDMHSDIDFEKHNISFYRDHFIHQVRVFYEMNAFLTNENFNKNFKDEFLNGDNKISDYVKQGVKRLVAEFDCSLLSPVFEKTKFKRTRQLISFNKYKIIEEHYLNYIIKASIALCSLFHDIGYPILHFRRLNKRISEFMPSMYMFLDGRGNNFEHMYALLCNSLLFRIVPKEELRSAFNVYTTSYHGVISAMAFLLMFYESGSIYSISGDKRIAIEIAAVAIYNHTIKYTELDSDGKIYSKPIYKLNPLSYLLRVCDDIEEWERVYFEIQKTPDFMFCNVCGTPLLRNIEDTENGLMNKLNYYCSCGRQNFYSHDDYVRRKIIGVVNCKEVNVLFDKSDIEFQFNYDLQLLLRSCFISPNFSKFRIKDLNKTKKLLMNQRFGGYTNSMISFFLTPNPFLLKAEILRKFIQINVNLDLSKNSKIKQKSHVLRGNKNYPDLYKCRGFYDNVCASSIVQWKTNFKSLLDTTTNLSNDTVGEPTMVDILEKSDKMQSYIEFFKSKFSSDFKIMWKNICIDISHLQSSAVNYISKFYSSNADIVIKLNSGRGRSLSFYYLLCIIHEFYLLLNREDTYSIYTYKDNSGKSIKDEFTEYINVELLTLAKDLIEQDNYIGSYNDISLFIEDSLLQYSKLFEDVRVNTVQMKYADYYSQFETDSEVYCAVEHYCNKDTEFNKPRKTKIGIEKVVTLDYYSDLELYIKFCEYTNYINAIYLENLKR